MLSAARLFVLIEDLSFYDLYIKVDGDRSSVDLHLACVSFSLTFAGKISKLSQVELCQEVFASNRGF